MQEMHAGSAYLCGAPAEMHFGLGAAVEVEVVKQEWFGQDRTILNKRLPIQTQTKPLRFIRRNS